MSTQVNLLNSWLRSSENDHPTEKINKDQFLTSSILNDEIVKKKISKNDPKPKITIKRNGDQNWHKTKCYDTFQFW